MGASEEQFRFRAALRPLDQKVVKSRNSSSGGGSNNERNVRMWFGLEKVLKEGRRGKEEREVGCCKQNGRS